MIKFLQNLFRRDAARPRPRRSAVPIPAKKAPPPPRQQTSKQQTSPDLVEVETELEGKIEDAGPGKNVLVRSKYQREDTGTHETLKIIDDRFVDDDDAGESGIDPYNTGEFDRSKNWDKRFRK